jgi:spore maturation protein CgeB
MKIAFYGSSLLSAYWNGAATYYRGMLSELAAARTTPSPSIEPDAFDRQQPPGHRPAALGRGRGL